MKKNIRIIILLFLISIFNSVSLAEAKIQSVVSANITIANDYVWRGKTQTNDKKVVQIGFDYDVGNGAILGIWSSNVLNGTEFDYYISYSGEVGDIDYEVGYIAYRYSEDAIVNRLNFDEIYIGGSYSDLGFTYYIGNGKKMLKVGNYVEASYNNSINDIDVSLTVGKYFEAVTGDGNDYKVYGISLGRSYKGLDLTLRFAENNSSHNIFNEKNTVFSISKSF